MRRHVARLLEILSLTCEGASGLISRRLDEPLGLGERLALYGHLLACGPCRRLRRQLALLREAFTRPSAAEDHDGEPGLSAEARARITRALGRSDERDPS